MRGIKGELENGVSDLNYDIYGTYGRTQATLTGSGRLGIGNETPLFSLDVSARISEVLMMQLRGVKPSWQSEAVSCFE